MSQTLCEKIDNYWEDGLIPKTVPDFVIEDLNPALPLRPYQQEAFARCFYYLNQYPRRLKPSQLLFNMATGSGKTLIMAGAVLYLYDQGYRNFLFFVNSTNIIDKTRDNFLNAVSSKYLFGPSIKFGTKAVKIREVPNFEGSDTDDISIVFTTIQGLHARLNVPRENALTFEDFADKQIVLISDEAHHINALTKNRNELSQDELLEFDTWEATVRRIFNSNPENILLEFTATVELAHPAVRQKYEDKLLFQYTLKQFREQGYSKEVRVHEADLAPLDRALQAVVVSQYRRKVAEKHGIALKPVLLMKSKTIPDSRAFQTQFHRAIEALDKKKLKKMLEGATGVVQSAYAYFEAQKITLDDLAFELRQDFDQNRTLIINSKQESEAKQLLVNSLEQSSNQIRVVFTVNMLNEGWDVLNLFDIVRLYNTRDDKKGVPGKTTISEAQLIGRGARYYPFQILPSQIPDQRKFDDDIQSELRVLETLYYYSAHNPEYIYELHKALVQVGITPPRSRIVTLKVKESIKKTNFWKRGLIYVNRKVHDDRQGIFRLEEAVLKDGHRYTLPTRTAQEAAILEDEEPVQVNTTTETVDLNDLGENVIRAALQRLEFFRFSNLKTYYPHLKSVHQFIHSPDYLGDVPVDLIGGNDQIHSLDQELKLRIAESVLNTIAETLKTGTARFNGTEIFSPLAIRSRVRDKILQISVGDNGDQERGIGMRETTNELLHLDLLEKDWYVYDENLGTDQEKYFVRFLDGMIKKLHERYSEIYLLRNEKLFTIHRFSDGAALEPDFALFLYDYSTGKSLVYQLFVEAKGEHLMLTDAWKQEALLEIADRHKLEVLIDNNEYRVIGMPFYNEGATKREFRARLEEL